MTRRRQFRGRARAIRTRSVGASRQGLYALNPPMLHHGEVHERVIVASAFGETHIFPTSGPIRVLASIAGTSLPAALAEVGYDAGRVA